MRIIGMAMVVSGGIIHANIAVRCANFWEYWALFGALLVVYLGGYIIGCARRISNEEQKWRNAKCHKDTCMRYTI